MSIADDLRAATLTKEQLEAERLEREKREFLSHVSTMVWHLQDTCRIAAGLTDTDYKVESIGHFSNKAYQVRFFIQW